ncbi:MAG: ATP-binding protein [Thermodesulfobacteriota bacterium]|nr:ATP-binding protein [Thermodesulfobacteriota bacterium]
MEQKITSLDIPGGDLNQNGLKCVYCVARDVTERNHLEDQLLQSQKLEAIGTLAGGIAHDFNNILMAIQGYTSLVRTSFKPGSPQYKKLANVDEYVQAGSEMTRQLLGLAQKKDNELSLENINYLLKMSAKMFGRTKKDVVLNLNLQKDLWSVKVDEGQIKQVMLNLYVNAWQAMPEGGRIYIKSENVSVGQSFFKKIGLNEPGRYVKISVVDTGAGMDNEVAEKIFNPSFTTKEMEGGTGLGLATAYGIVNNPSAKDRGACKVTCKPG